MPTARGRTRTHTTRAHSLAAYRLQKIDRLAHAAADSILELPDSALRRALAALQPDVLAELHAALSRARTGTLA